MTAPALEAIGNALRDELGDVTLDAEVFPSGAVAVLLRRSGHVVSIQGTADGEWGYSVDWDDADGLGGHDHVADTPEDTAAGVAGLLGGRTG